MSEARAATVTRRDPATVAGIATGAVVAGLLMASLLHPEMGRYLTEAIALVCALGAAGIALFVVVQPGGGEAVMAVRRPAMWLAVAAFAAALITLPFAIMAVSGDGIRGLGDGLARSAALRSGDYETVVARAVGLVVIVGALRRPFSQGGRVVLLLGALLAVVAATLVFSTVNHLRLVPAAETGNVRAVRVLRANIAAEQFLLATVLVVTEILMRQNPGG